MTADSPTATVLQSDSARSFSIQALADAKARLVSNGITYAEWADQQGFSRRMVYEVLSGRRKCRAGQSHRIAVALGLKTPMRPPQSSIAGERLEGVRK